MLLCRGAVMLHLDRETRAAITITLGRNKLETLWSHREKMSFEELAARLAKSAPGAKDGPCSRRLFSAARSEI
jgi:hypothetical protein